VAERVYRAMIAAFVDLGMSVAEGRDDGPGGPAGA
jgi:hypothetical protein